MEQPKYSVIANGVTTYYATQEQIVENLDRVSQQIKLGQMNAQEIHLDYKSIGSCQFSAKRWTWERSSPLTVPATPLPPPYASA